MSYSDNIGFGKKPQEADDDDLIVPDKWRGITAETASTHKKFDPTLCNPSTDMVSVVQRLMLAREFAGANFLFHGPSGTGKTEFGRFIAKQLRMPVTVVHTGDVMFSKWGATERVIEKIFKDAARQGHVLIFDEADSFLYDRRRAEQVWERQIVNEYLRHMETHTQPLICTTNLIDELDPAVMRRFMFKVEFKPLDAAQAARVFKHYFKLEAPEYLSKLPNLTLGDFGIVQKKAAVLGYLHDTPALCQLFYEEALNRHTTDAARATKHAKKQAAS